MNVLITGRGSSGSWQIRAVQLGVQMGIAKVQANATRFDGIDVVVGVKRVSDGVVKAVRRAGLPFVWDVVDAWPQPTGNHWGTDAARTWIANELARVRPNYVVAPTAAFAEDLARWGLFDPTRMVVLRHHANPAFAPRPTRTHVAVVAYQGGAHYLGRWEQSLERACTVRGWRFVVNPDDMGAADIVVALRDYQGWPARRWKSNVKLANAQALGRPFIGSRECGYEETQSGVERWANCDAQLDAAFDELVPYEQRVQIGNRMAAAAPKIATVANQYAEFLKGIAR